MSQPLPYDEIEMWKGYPNCYIKKLKTILNTPIIAKFGFFLKLI